MSLNNKRTKSDCFNIGLLQTFIYKVTNKKLHNVMKKKKKNR